MVFKFFLPSSLAFISFVIFSYVFVPYKIEGVSMEPTYHSGDYVFLNRAYLYTHALERGDIVGFMNVREKYDSKKKMLLKRIYGLPGERIYIEEGKIWIQEADGYVYRLINHKDMLPDPFKDVSSGTILGPEDYFVLGDNLTLSEDSRNFGTLQRNEMIGNVFMSF